MQYILILLLFTSCSSTLDYKSFVCYPIDDDGIACSAQFDMQETRRLKIATDKVRR
jgi:hypothetical protein